VNRAGLLALDQFAIIVRIGYHCWICLFDQSTPRSYPPEHCALLLLSGYHEDHRV
jgi:hypothetical protein